MSTHSLLDLRALINGHSRLEFARRTPLKRTHCSDMAVSGPAVNSGSEAAQVWYGVPLPDQRRLSPGIATVAHTVTYLRLDSGTPPDPGNRSCQLLSKRRESAIYVNLKLLSGVPGVLGICSRKDLWDNQGSAG